MRAFRYAFLFLGLVVATMFLFSLALDAFEYEQQRFDSQVPLIEENDIER